MPFETRSPAGSDSGLLSIAEASAAPIVQRRFAAAPVLPGRLDSAPQPAADSALDRAVDELLCDCREILQARFAGLEQRLPLGRRTPQDWFHLLQTYRRTGPQVETLQRLREEAGLATGELEQFALLQAMRRAAPGIASLPVAPSTKQALCARLARILQPEPQWQGWYDFAGWRFLEMAQFVTLARYPAGQHDWEVSFLARSWLAKARPTQLPRLLAGIAFRLGGLRPLARIHLNAWRPDKLVILKSEAERAYFRIAQCLPLQPELRGLMAYSWFYSAAMREISPHLCWLRDFFAENGATIVEMEKAPPDYSFQIGGAGDRALGRLRPRLTLVLWPRADMLAWAKRRPDLAA